MKRLNVDISDLLHRRLKLAAFHQGVTLSALVTELLEAHVDQLDAVAAAPRRRASDWDGAADQQEPG